MGQKDEFVIAQFSDIHCGDRRFDEWLMKTTIAEINASHPDLVLVPGDLTADGYRDQFQEARSYIDTLDCQAVVIAGNHDCRQVGYLHFEDLFGPRSFVGEYEFGLPDDGVQDKVKVFALDSNKPDLNDGEVGRNKNARIVEEFKDYDGFKILMLHHHLVSIPGTGRERNIVLDAGDVLEALRNAEVDLVVAGHKHVPYTWPIAGMLVCTSGTASTHRTRGYAEPSYNMIRITKDEVHVEIHDPGHGVRLQECFPRKRRSGTRTGVGGNEALGEPEVGPGPNLEPRKGGS